MLFRFVLHQLKSARPRSIEQFERQQPFALDINEDFTRAVNYGVSMAC